MLLIFLSFHDFLIFSNFHIDMFRNVFIYAWALMRGAILCGRLYERLYECLCEWLYECIYELSLRMPLRMAQLCEGARGTRASAMSLRMALHGQVVEYEPATEYDMHARYF